MRNRLYIVGLLVVLVVSVCMVTVTAQEETPEATPATEMPTEATPATEITIEPTLDVEITVEVTPDTETTAEVTPDIERTVEVTPNVESTPEVTPEAETTIEVVPQASATPAPVGNEFFTATRPFSEALMNQLVLPEGFEISVFAQNLGNPRMMVVSDNGVIYVSRPETNDVIALFDQNANGTADTPGFRIVASNIPVAHGLVIRDNRLYIAGVGQILVADILDDGGLGVLETITDALPAGERHNKRTLGFGPDGNLYIGVGSTCNACVESNPNNATILTLPLDGSQPTVFAEGLRNSMGFNWHPETGDMWAVDNGSDWRGDDQPPEELNLLQRGNHYGWPFCYDNQAVDLYFTAQASTMNGMSQQDFCNTTTAPTLTYQAHSAPIDLLFYTADQFPDEYINDAFVTMRGSWNRVPATGYKVVRIHFDDNGQPTEITDFVSGFLIEDGTAHFGRLAGLAIGPDGALLISDDTNGIIYRVAYTNP